jgi:ribosome-binding factor A
LRLKKSPTIAFVLDDSIAKAARIGDLLMERKLD